MMMSPIGEIPFHPFAKNSIKKRGVTFVELMVALAILSFGIISIYKAFFITLNYMNHLTYRMHAIVLLDNKITLLQKRFEQNGEIPLLKTQEIKSLTIDHKLIDFFYTVNIGKPGHLKNFYELQIFLSWKERARQVQISRTAFLGNYREAE